MTNHITTTSRDTSVTDFIAYLEALDADEIVGVNKPASDPMAVLIWRNDPFSRWMGRDGGAGRFEAGYGGPRGRHFLRGGPVMYGRTAWHGYYLEELTESPRGAVTAATALALARRAARRAEEHARLFGDNLNGYITRRREV